MKKEKPKPKRKFRPSDNTQYLTVAGGAILVLLVTFALNDFAGPTQDTWGMVIASVGGLGVMILPLLLHIDDKGNTDEKEKEIKELTRQVDSLEEVRHVKTIEGNIAQLGNGKQSVEEVRQLKETLQEELEALKAVVGENHPQYHKLSNAINKASDKAEAEAMAMRDVFISIPMSALLPAEVEKDSEEANQRADQAYHDNQILAQHTWNAIKNNTQATTCYSAILDHANLEEMDDEQAADDLDRLKMSANFVMILPEKMVTSCLVEVGYAIALDIPCLVFVRDRGHLPYVLQEIGQQRNNVKIYRYNNHTNIAGIIDQHGANLLNFDHQA
jgi:hypothetical protein